jgi:hypothetical protein
MVEHSQDKYFVDNRKDFGWHDKDGIFVFSGQDFKQGSASRDWHVMDIPATLLHLYSVPIPEDYDGQSLVETLSPEFLENHPITYQPGDNDLIMSLDDVYSEQEADEVLAHLKSLGYVD